MVSVGAQILGVALGIIGWFGIIITCALPQWKVSSFTGSNIVTAQTTQVGIWMSCVVQSTGQTQCKVYDSMLELSSDRQAARALVVISILIGLFGILAAVAGGKCTNCVEDEKSKAKICIAAGAMFIVSGLMCLVPLCWTAHNVIREFYNPTIPGERMEMGPALFIGWGASALILLGGGILCASCPPKDDFNPTAKYNAAAPVSNRGYV